MNPMEVFQEGLIQPVTNQPSSSAPTPETASARQRGIHSEIYNDPKCIQIIQELNMQVVETTTGAKKLKPVGNRNDLLQYLPWPPLLVQSCVPSLRTKLNALNRTFEAHTMTMGVTSVTSTPIQEVRDEASYKEQQRLNIIALMRNEVEPVGRLASIELRQNIPTPRAIHAKKGKGEKRKYRPETPQMEAISGRAESSRVLRYVRPTIECLPPVITLSRTYVAIVIFRTFPKRYSADLPAHKRRLADLPYYMSQVHYDYRTPSKTEQAVMVMDAMRMVIHPVSLSNPGFLWRIPGIHTGTGEASIDWHKALQPDEDFPLQPPNIMVLEVEAVSTLPLVPDDDLRRSQAMRRFRRLTKFAGIYEQYFDDFTRLFCIPPAAAESAGLGWQALSSVFNCSTPFHFDTAYNTLERFQASCPLLCRLFADIVEYDAQPFVRYLFHSVHFLEYARLSNRDRWVAVDIVTGAQPTRSQPSGDVSRLKDRGEYSNSNISRSNLNRPPNRDQPKRSDTLPHTSLSRQLLSHSSSDDAGSNIDPPSTPQLNLSDDIPLEENPIPIEVSSSSRNPRHSGYQGQAMNKFKKPEPIPVPPEWIVESPQVPKEQRAIIRFSYNVHTPFYLRVAVAFHQLYPLANQYHGPGLPAYLTPNFWEIPTSTQYRLYPDWPVYVDMVPHWDRLPVPDEPLRQRVRTMFQPGGFIWENWSSAIPYVEDLYTVAALMAFLPIRLTFQHLEYTPVVPNPFEKHTLFDPLGYIPELEEYGRGIDDKGYWYIDVLNTGVLSTVQRPQIINRFLSRLCQNCKNKEMKEQWTRHLEIRRLCNKVDPVTKDIAVDQDLMNPDPDFDTDLVGDWFKVEAVDDLLIEGNIQLGQFHNDADVCLSVYEGKFHVARVRRAGSLLCLLPTKWINAFHALQYREDLRPDEFLNDEYFERFRRIVLQLHMAVKYRQNWILPEIYRRRYPGSGSKIFE